jgi:hypothetical protein
VLIEQESARTAPGGLDNHAMSRRTRSTNHMTQIFLDLVALKAELSRDG